MQQRTKKEKMEQKSRRERVGGKHQKEKMQREKDRRKRRTHLRAPKSSSGRQEKRCQQFGLAQLSPVAKDR